MHKIWICPEFVHGSLCDYRYWQPQLAGLSKHYRCIAVSLTHYWPAADTEPGLPFEGDPKEAPGVVDFWPLETEFGLQNARSGVSLLVVTGSPTPPTVRPTYAARPAELNPGERYSGGLVRLARVVGGAGEGVRECEFEAEDDRPTNLV